MSSIYLELLRRFLSHRVLRPHRGWAASVNVALLMVAAAAHSAVAASERPTSIPGLHYYYPPERAESRVLETDICVYGGTSGGVAAAVQAGRMELDVVLLAFGERIGGLTSGGLSETDGGSPDVTGGIAREFYDVAGQTRFNASVAESIFLRQLEEADVRLERRAHLAAVEKRDGRIVSITMRDGLVVRAKQFIDCTYEGDLMAMAGVSFTVGRESNQQYGETLNGIRPMGKGGHNFPADIDPYLVKGEPSSGLLPRILPEPPGPVGASDDRVQAFCFRMFLTQDDPLPFPRPLRYDPAEYELIARLFEAGADPKISWYWDTNNHHLFNGAYFIDYVGGNYDWPEGDYERREELFQEHLDYQLGVMWFLSNDPRVPAEYQRVFQTWGLPRDEYTATGGWTHELYVREGRRMVGDFVMTEQHIHRLLPVDDSIGLGSYNMDSHHCSMAVVDGYVRSEGNVEVAPKNGPYPISYRAIVPKREECLNLSVPWALSATHIAFGSIRMEPVFMTLGQSASTAAALAIQSGLALQDVDYEKLREKLLKDGQKLDPPNPLTL